MPQIKKQISVVLISLTFLLFMVPLVSATSETFMVPASGSHDLAVDLNQGDNVRFNVTVSWGSNNGFSRKSIELEITDPNGNSIQNYDINYDPAVNYYGYAFSAPITGKYLLHFVSSSSDNTVTLTYSIAPYDPILIASIISVIVIIAIAGITLAAKRIHKARKRQKAILESSGQDNLPQSSVYDEARAKRASEIIGIKDSSNVSWEDSKRGILLRCKNAWLSNNEFFYSPSYFPISNMAEASVNEKSCLTVKLKNGEIKEFKLAPDATALELTNRLAVSDQEFANDTFRTYLKRKNQQWADAINKLIHERLEAETVTCKYCGSKNKDTDVKCTYCGANL